MAYHFIPSRMFLCMLALMALEIPFSAGTADCAKRPPKVNPLTCCTLPNIITDEVMEKCKMSMPTAAPSESSSEMSEELKPRPTGSSQRQHHRTPHGPPMHACFLSCVLNETGIMMAEPDAKLNEEKLSAYLKIALVNSTSMIPFMETSFKACAAKEEEMRLKLKEKMQKKNSSESGTSSTQDRMLRPLHHQCSPIAGHLMRCVFLESMVNCPTSILSHTAECNEMRDFIKNCKPTFNDKTGISNAVDEM